MSDRFHAPKGRRSTTGVLLAVSLAALPTRAPAAEAPPPPPRWIVIDSPSFRLTTDLDEALARERLQHFEQLRAALFTVAFADLRRSGVRLQLILHRDREQKVGSVDSAYLLDFYGQGAGVVGWDDPARPYARFLGETALIYGQLAVPGSPYWFTMGLASNLGTMMIVGDELFIGAPVGATGFGVPSQDIPTIAELVADSRSRFGGSSARLISGGITLVHMFLWGPERYRARFGRLWELLAEGRRFDVAWERSLGQTAPERIEEDYREHAALARLERRTLGIAPPLGPLPSAPAHVMTPTEVAVLHARFSFGDDWKAAEKELVRIAPDDPEALQLRALNSTDKAASMALLVHCLVVRPDDVGCRASYLSRKLSEAETAPDPRAAVSALEVDAQRLMKRAQTAMQLATLARYFRLHGEPQRALPFALRAYEKESTCPPCVDVLSRVEEDVGDLPAALRMARRYEAMVQEPKKQQEIRARLGELERKAEAAEKK